MKRCPECDREYDPSMMFCLDDGAELLYGPATDEPATAILSDPAALSGESATRAQIHTTAPAAEPQTYAGASTERPSLSAHRAAEPQASFDKRIIAVPLVLAIIALGAFFGYRYFKPALAEQISSVAVMPFQNAGGNAEAEYLSDGLAESLIYRLSQLPNLKVSPVSSVMRYKGKEFDAQKIAAELGVQAVMSGRMIQRGDNLSISVELIDVANNKTLWGEQYERKMSDLLATQREIATAIVGKLQVRLSGDDAKGVTKKYTNSNEAYQLYLKGRHFWSRRTSENIVKAIESLKAATDIDPNFALAYVGLADCYIVAPQYVGTPSSEALPKARAYAQKALEIDDSLAEAHVSLGAVYDQSWQWAESEKAYKSALELNPNYATAHHWYSIYLRHQGRIDEALEHIKRAHELDPLSLAITANLGQALYQTGNPSAAAEQFTKAIELDPNNPMGYLQLGTHLLLTGRVDEAEPFVKKAIETSNRSTESLRLLGFARAVGGKPGEAKAVIDEMQERRARGKASGVQIACVHSALGDNDKAFEILEEDFKNNQGEMANMLFFSEYQSLRSDPRFNELLVRMGLPKLK